MEWVEVRRQIFHLANGTIILVAMKHYGKPVGWIIIALSLIGACLSWYHSKVKPFKWAEPFLLALEREENMNLPGKGAVLYGLSVGITILLFKPLPAQCGIAALAYGDAFSTIIGKSFGRRSIPWNPKLSVEGSTAFVAATTCLGTLFVPLPYSFSAGVIGAFAETIPGIDDNLSIPLLTALIMSMVS